MKIAINKCYGGFSVSKEVYDELGLEWDEYGMLDNAAFGIKSDNWDEYRADPKLIAAIEKIGLEESSGKYADIGIVEIPDDVKWEIDDYDGIETIHEQHRTW